MPPRATPASPGSLGEGARAHCEVRWLGTGVDYRWAWGLQSRLAEDRASGALPDTLLLLEHAAVYTAGRSSGEGEVLLGPAELRQLGVEVLASDRGGRTTYHGPGQLVGYPILSLRERGMGPRDYVRALERVLVGTLGEFGIAGELEEGLTGVWAGGAKVAAIGVRVRRGVTMHGFSLNVDPDLAYFAHIVPCGIRDRAVTSMADLLGHAPPGDDVRAALVRHFAQVFSLRPVTEGRGRGSWDGGLHRAHRFTAGSRDAAPG